MRLGERGAMGTSTSYWPKGLVRPPRTEFALLGDFYRLAVPLRALSPFRRPRTGRRNREAVL